MSGSGRAMDEIIRKLAVAVMVTAGGILLALTMLALANGFGADPPWRVAL